MNNEIEKKFFEAFGIPYEKEIDNEYKGETV